MGRHVYESFNDYAQQLMRRAEGAETAMQRSNFECAAKLTEDSVNILQREVYDIPEKRYSLTGRKRTVKGTTRGWTQIGRKVWVRTHTLINEERFIVQGDKVVHKNPTAYMIFRYRYGTVYGRPAIPPQQRSHWYTDAIRRNATWIHRNRHHHLFMLLDQD